MSDTKDPDRSEDAFDLLLSMRRATRRSHHVANALILTKLVVVLTDKKLYAQALGSFLPVYQKLEKLMQQHTTVPGLKTVITAVKDIPSRAAAMEEDLQHLLGSNWRSAVVASPAAEAYAAHLQHLADKDPVLLLPYVFSMHIPILLGFLAQRIQRTLQLPDQQGLAFFTVSTVCLQQ
jgi:heme oxygenase